LDEASACYRRILPIKPGLSAARIKLIDVVRRLGRNDDAVAACRQWLESEPAQPEARHIIQLSVFFR
jgi:hypothetical protein